MKILTFFILFSMLNFCFAQENQREQIDSLIDSWHHAAAIADEDTFFLEVMDSASIYIGTDATELWTSMELKDWSKKFFDREKAWVFTPTERNIYFSKDEKVAWFDELLDTWMGVCRGSGVLELEGDRWVLRHYHLAIAVPNEVVQDYLKLLKNN